MKTALVFIGIFFAGMAQADDAAPEMHYAFEMKPDAVKKLHADMYKIRKGDTLFLVKALLGKPCAEYDSTTRRVEQAEKMLGTTITYCVKTQQQGRLGENDHTIDLQFDLDGHLQYARAQNEWCRGTFATSNHPLSLHGESYTTTCLR